jgi:hypothetical protein
MNNHSTVLQIDKFLQTPAAVLATKREPPADWKNCGRTGQWRNQWRKRRTRCLNGRGGREEEEKEEPRKRRKRRKRRPEERKRLSGCQYVVFF